jgi:hypothetical protein
MPVRIFTYLIGKDSTGAENLQTMACSNKGGNFHKWDNICTQPFFELRTMSSQNQINFFDALKVVCRL